jgi:hypothetical protein
MSWQEGKEKEKIKKNMKFGARPTIYRAMSLL